MFLFQMRLFLIVRVKWDERRYMLQCVKFQKYIETMKSRSIFDFDINVNEEDNILTLSTCGNNNKYRVILQARKM